MKKTAVAISLCLALAGCKDKGKTGEGVSENSTPATEMAGAAADWEILFDGTNTDKWRGYGSDELFSEWQIEDGTLSFNPSKDGGKNIITKDTYTNFILSVEWKISKKGNSGILWSVQESEKFKEPYVTGPEIQVLDNAEHPDSFVAEGTHKAGSLYDMIKCPEELIKPAGEWNLCVLEVNHKANEGKVSMNGTEAFTFPLHGSEWDAMVENSKFKDWEDFGEHHTGHISLQDHNDKVWYKNIKIQRLEE